MLVNIAKGIAIVSFIVEIVGSIMLSPFVIAGGMIGLLVSLALAQVAAKKR